MQGGMGNFEPAKFIPFHFVKFASLTSLVKDQTEPKYAKLV